MTTKFFVSTIVCAAIAAASGNVMADGPSYYKPPCDGCAPATVPAQPEPIKRIEAPAFTPAPATSAADLQLAEMLNKLQENESKLEGQIGSVGNGLKTVQDKQDAQGQQLSALERKVDELSTRIDHLQSASQQRSQYAQVAPAATQAPQASSIQWQSQGGAATVYVSQPNQTVAYLPPRPRASSQCDVPVQAAYSPTYPASYPQPCDSSAGYNAGVNNGGYTSSYLNGNNINLNLGGLSIGGGRSSGGYNQSCAQPSYRSVSYCAPVRPVSYCPPAPPCRLAPVCVSTPICRQAPVCNTGGGSRSGGGGRH